MDIISSESNKSVHTSDFEDIYYRGFSLFCRKEGTKYIGEAYRSDKRVAYCESTNPDSSLQDLRSIADKLIAIEVDERQNALPSSKEFGHAIQRAYFHIPNTTQNLLNVFQSSGDNTFQLEALRTKSKSKDTTEVSILLAQLGRLLCDLVAYEPPTPFDGRDPFLALIVDAFKNCPNSDSPITLKLTKHFYNALHSLERPL